MKMCMKVVYVQGSDAMKMCMKVIATLHTLYSSHQGFFFLLVGAQVVSVHH